ncbi:hypothetical protein AA0481_0580 [Acetobacter orientalis NRIC 0481]|uniref:Uncharacterized protein n=1 Tax=Acetobacter orientalis TaxID=146474 RepID=A0A0D6NMQ2_9PROT|nr:hypothetical protein Abor_031_059 [Acetobacter orientalis]GBR14315.1 hypothetical protein AA0481_0580 [Acetobacter orientalis NRIC 0481]GEL60862.1 hypothetical protein AOR02nite_07040 [Acetobacter orientalis]
MGGSCHPYNSLGERDLITSGTDVTNPNLPKCTVPTCQSGANVGKPCALKSNSGKAGSAFNLWRYIAVKWHG